MPHSRLFHFDERRDIALPGSLTHSIEFAVNHFIHIAVEATEQEGYFAVALSGGSTPKKIFEMLATPKYRNAIEWSKVLLFWSDERAVPPDHPESNYKMAMDSGLSKLELNEDQIFRMKAENDIQEHALEYERIIRKKLNGRPFHLIMLGMGDDGHTASLFPHTQALNICDRLVVANEVPQKQCWRMTFTFTTINQAHHTAIYVMGEDKSETLANVLMDPTNSFPSARVGTPAHPALLIVDDNASRKLLKTWDINRQK